MNDISKPVKDAGREIRVNKQNLFTRQDCAASSTNVNGLAGSTGSGMTAGAEREHITQEMLRAYVRGTLPVQAESEVMRHIAGCDRCAGHFADLLMADNPVSPPPGLKKNILDKTVYRKEPGWAMKRLLEVRQEKQRELFIYCARVVFAMAASVLMVFSVSSGKYGVQRTLPVETVQVRQREPERARERKGMISGSLKKASGKVGDALADFMTLFNGTEEEEGR